MLLLGRDDLISDIFPAYKTDALLRRVDTLRYDDRVTTATNLIESWDQLIAFGQKHLDDKFYINEKGLRFSLRDSILREVIGNLLIHREFSSARPGRFIIEKDRIFADNASKAFSYGVITMENLHPEPKNPIIAKFFNNICRADELGSGVRNLYRDVRIYSNAEPIVTEADVFSVEVPLLQDNAETTQTTTQTATQTTTQTIALKPGPALEIVRLIESDCRISSKNIAEKVGLTRDGVNYHIRKLKALGILTREGGRFGGKWVITVPPSADLDAPALGCWNFPSQIGIIYAK